MGRPGRGAGCPRGEGDMLNSGDLRAQEAPGQNGEGLRVTGGGEVMARFWGIVPAQKVPAGQRPVDVLGGLVRGGHQGHVLPMTEELGPPSRR